MEIEPLSSYEQLQISWSQNIFMDAFKSLKENLNITSDWATSTHAGQRWMNSVVLYRPWGDPGRPWKTLEDPGRPWETLTRPGKAGANTITLAYSLGSKLQQCSLHCFPTAPLSILYSTPNLRATYHLEAQWYPDICSICVVSMSHQFVHNSHHHVVQKDPISLKNETKSFQTDPTV